METHYICSTLTTLKSGHEYVRTICNTTKMVNLPQKCSFSKEELLHNILQHHVCHGELLTSSTDQAQHVRNTDQWIIHMHIVKSQLFNIVQSMPQLSVSEYIG